MPQRVNTRFLIILTIVVAAFVALGLAAKFLLHRNPKNFVAAGDAAAHSGNWPLAAANYNRAISLGVLIPICTFATGWRSSIASVPIPTASNRPKLPTRMPWWSIRATRRRLVTCWR